MTQYINITEGSGKKVAFDEIDIGGGTLVHHQMVKVLLGGANTDGGLLSSSNPLPITKSASEAVWIYGTFDSSTLNNTWQSLKTAPSNPYKGLEINNDSLIGVLVSFDAGSNTHRWVPAKTSWTIDLEAIGLKESSAIHIKGASASTGTIYIQGVTA